MKILLTNDDSHQSPLLEFVLEELKRFAEVTIVVPKHEQSWKGKSMVRFGYLHLEETTICGHKAFTVDGTPADCVNIGIYHLYDGIKPDLIVSGINAGLNAGLGFIWSSGTLGACFEANIAGIPGIALSQHFDSETRETYIASYAISDPTYSKLKKQTGLILDKLLQLFLVRNRELLAKPITWNINFPFNLNPEMRYEVCSSGLSFYGSCYTKTKVASGLKDYQGIRFEHELVDIYKDPSDRSDNALLEAGHVTITPIDITTFAQLSDASAREMARKFN